VHESQSAVLLLYTPRDGLKASENGWRMSESKASETLKPVRPRGCLLDVCTSMVSVFREERAGSLPKSPP
jgi:hypothetical protein